MQDALAEKLRCRGAVSHRHVLVRAWGDRDLHGSSSPCCDLLLDLTPRRGKPPAHYVPEVKSTICWELAAAPNWFPPPQAINTQQLSSGRSEAQMSQLTTETNGTSPRARLEAIGCCHIRGQARKKLEGNNNPAAPALGANRKHTALL